MEDAFSRCHPILNVFYFAVVLGCTMSVQHPVFLAISFTGACAYAMWLLGWREALKRNVMYTLPLLIIIAVLNTLFNHYGVTPLFYLARSGNWVTLEAFVYGIVLGCVLFIVIGWFSCFNKVMTSDKYVYLLGRLLPAASLLLSMALRFVPRFTAQMKIIRNGQKCVGMDVSNAKFIKKAQYGLNMLSILVTWALENAIDTADSMKSRGYGLPGRSAFSIYRFDKRDVKMLCVLLAFFCLTIFGCTQGVTFAQYNPRILIAGVVIQGKAAPVECGMGVAFLTFLSFGIFCFIPLILGIVEEVSMKKSQLHIGKEMEHTYRQIYEELDEEREEQL